MTDKEKAGGTQKKQNNLSSRKYAKYKIEGASISRGKNCPRCGPGIFLAITKDRVYCGKCHYTEFLVKAKS